MVPLFTILDIYNHSLSGMNRQPMDIWTESICILVESDKKPKKNKPVLIYFHSGLRFYPQSRTYTGFHTGGGDIPPPDFRPNLLKNATTFRLQAFQGLRSNLRGPKLKPVLGEHTCTYPQTSQGAVCFASLHGQLLPLPNKTSCTKPRYNIFT